MGEATDVVPAQESAASCASPPAKVVEEASPTKQRTDSPPVEKCEEKEVSAATAPPLPFVEESYHVKDLKEAEKKALLELKAKIREALKSNSFLAPPAPAKAPEATPKEADVVGGEKEKEEVEEKQAEVTPEEFCKDGVSPPVVEEREACVSAEEKPKKESEVAPEEKPNEDEAREANPSEAVDVCAEEEEEDLPSFEDLSLWGVPLLHSKGDERTDVVLLKFLRARDFKVNEAMSMLKDTVIWRKEFGADSLFEEEVAMEFDSVAYMHGVDKEGHPVCYNNFGVFQDNELYQKTFTDEAEFRKFLRWRIQLLEKGIKKLDFSPNGVHSMVQVIDLKDSPGILKIRNIINKTLTLLQDNYPELVAKQIYINVPWYFGALISLHSALLTPRSKSKVVVARPGKVTETLFRYISPEHVALNYGGFRRPNDSEFEGVDALVKEISLKAGEKQTIEIPVEECGSTLVWDLAVAGWDVVYGEEFVPSAEGGYTVIIQKTKKVATTEEAMRNTFKATEPGKVVLTVENTSRRKKLLVYRHTTKKEITV